MISVLMISKPFRFIDRREELAALEGAREGGRAGLYVVLGRRRVGKTELLSRFCQGKPSLIVFVREGEKGPQAASVSREIAQSLGDTSATRAPPSDLDGMMELVERFLGQPGRPVLVIDEFQNLVAGRREALSAFQAAWDLRLQRGEGTLVLCGSAVGMIEDFVGSPRSPLYGRSTLRIELRPLAFWNCSTLLPERASQARILRFAVTGGVPHYLQALHGFRDLRSAIIGAVLSKGAPLYDEPAAMIRSETREPDRYFSILEAIAGGAARPIDIADRSGLTPSELGPYLKVLTDSLRLVERRIPVTARRAGGKLGLYRLADPFSRFWFSCVAPRKSMLERGTRGPVADEAMERLPTLAGPVLEDIVMDAMAATHGTNWQGLRMDFTSIGSWWNRRGDEIDIVALGGREGAIAAEVTLGRRPVDRSEVDRLVAKLPLLPIKGPVRPALVTAGTFTSAARERAEEAGITAVDGRALAKVMARLAAP